MTMITRDEFWTPADRAEFAMLALKTLAQLVTFAFQSGEDMRHWEGGLVPLFEAQFEVLQEANQELRSRLVEEKRVAETGAADSERVHGLRRQLIAGAVSDGAEASEIASALNMRKAAVDKVIRQLRGGGGNEAPQRMAG